MSKRTIIIILAALAVALLIVASWWWFFHRQSTPGANTGTFGTGQDRNTGSTSGGNGQNNTPSGIGGAGTGSNIGTGGGLGGGTGGPGSGGLGGGNTGSGVTVDIQSTSTVTVGPGTGPAGPGAGNPDGGPIEPGTGPGPNIGTVEPGPGTGPGTVGGVGGPPDVDVVNPVPVGTTSVGWLGPDPNGSPGGPVSSFIPSTVNQLNDGSTGGQVTLFGTPPTPDNPNDLAAALAVAGIGTALCTVGLIPSPAYGAVAAANKVTAVSIADSANDAKNATDIQTKFLDCITRSIGRAIVQQITSSVVNWINSGFKGSPSFVTNFQQFFANVADQAAGAYIKGSALSFLCSPFQAQIKIAIAKSYANRNAQSCSLSQVTNNINNFMKGNFSAGGWPAALSFTSTPTNNPYGAYAYAQVGLINAQSAATANANKNVNPGGFISFSQATDCKGADVGKEGTIIKTSLFLTPTQAASGVGIPGCKTKIVTPGDVIQSTLQKTIGNPLDQLGLAKSFDEILNALITQLITRTLYQGLGNLSGQNGYENNFLTPDQQQAQTQGNALLLALQNAQQTARQYGTVAQGSIADIQNAQGQLQTLANCWETAATSDFYPAGQRATAAANASAALAAQATLETKVGLYNDTITKANTSIAYLEDLQSRTLSINSTAEVTAITNEFNAAAAAGEIITAADITSAQQDRTTLQATLQGQNADTAAKLNQCRAFLPPETQ